MFKFSRGEGTFVIDRRFGKLGRIRKASGTTDPATFGGIIGMLKTLYQTGRHQILKEIQQGTIKAIDVYGYWIDGKLDHVPSSATLRPLSETFPGWLKQHDIAKSTRTIYEQQYDYFVRQVGDEVPLCDLPVALNEYREHCDEKEIYRSFNIVRTCFQAFINSQFSQDDSLYHRLRAVKKLKEVPKIESTTLSPAEVGFALETLMDIGKGDHLWMAETMYVSGMRLGEYLGNQWEALKDRVVIRGTKSKAAKRVVPLIDSHMFRATRGQKMFRRALRIAGIRPHDLRRSYAHLLEMAQVPRSRRLSYLGHSHADTLDRHYEAHEVSKYLIEDAERCRTYIGESVEAAKREDHQERPEVFSGLTW